MGEIIDIELMWVCPECGTPTSMTTEECASDDCDYTLPFEAYEKALKNLLG